LSRRRERLALAAAFLTLAASCAALTPMVGTTSPPAPSHPPPGTPGAPGAPAFDLRSEPMIDVGLAWDVDSLSLQLVAGARLDYRMMNNTFGGKWERRVVMRMVGGHAQVIVNAVTGSPLQPGDTLEANAAGPTHDEARVLWNGKTWRGTLRVFVNPRGKLTVADRLPLETYLLGVVPGEIGVLDEKLIEAGKAQAIAARSYTLFYRGRRAAEGFDLYGTVEDQVYGPVESERPVAARCVESTRGMILLSRGSPIRANYCSTCGGMSAEVWEAWPAEALPYLVSRADRGAGDWCAESPQYRWREEWTPAEFMDNVRRFAPAQAIVLPASGLGELIDVRVESRSSSGRVWRLRIQGRNGDVVLPAYVIRQVLRRGGNPNAILRSNLFKIGVRRDPATRRPLAVVASGAGSGHGVGLCQTGALGMARAGTGTPSILAHYYPSATLEKRY